MKSIRLEKQEAVEVDEATRAAIELALAELQRGEGTPMEEVRDLVRKQHKAWEEAQKRISVR